VRRGGLLARVGSIKTKLGLVVAGATAIGLLGAVYGLQSGFRVRWTLLLSLALALLVVQLLARGMTAPLREMAAAATAMARGQHDVRVAVTTRDEVGQLAEAFNAMAAELAAVDAQRRRLVADVSHELRTPLTALQALLENLADGVTRPDPEVLGTALAQTRRLGSAGRPAAGPVAPGGRRGPAGAGRGRPRPPARRCRRRGAGRRPAARVEVAVQPPELTVVADPERLAQVLANLLDNATRHAPPAAGCRPPPAALPTAYGSRWSTTGPASRRRTASGCSTGSPAPTPPGRGPDGGSGLGPVDRPLGGRAARRDGPRGGPADGGGCRVQVDLPA
jgi:HAMP domain-containing protein